MQSSHITQFKQREKNLKDQNSLEDLPTNNVEGQP